MFIRIKGTGMINTLVFCGAVIWGGSLTIAVALWIVEAMPIRIADPKRRSSDRAQ